MNHLPPPRTYSEFWQRVICLSALHSATWNSGGRTEERNAKVGGHPESWHRIERGALAVDLQPDHVSERKLKDMARDARKLGFHVVATYPTHIHLQPVAPGVAW